MTGTPESDVAFSRQGVAVVMTRQTRLLVIRRSQHVIAPGLFCFPGGGIELGESEMEAVVREMSEELRIAVQPLRRLWRSVTPWRVGLAWWLAEMSEGAEPDANPAEVESIHWHTPEEMSLLPDLLPSNHDFLKALARGEFHLEADRG